MKKTNSMDIFPKMQIKPFDGMSITAEVWEQAHGEHRQAFMAHNLVSHGSGIITGLEVVANDPPDQFVFISPGAAVDSAGNVIVVPEPVAYDFGGASEGPLLLLLGKGEREVGGAGNDAKFTQAEFVISARASLPKRASVELARVTVSEAGKAIKNADDPLHPEIDMLDLRFRARVGPTLPERVRVLVLNLGGDEPEVLLGWDYLGAACRQGAAYDLVVDAAKTLPEDLGAFDVIYIACKGEIASDAAMVKALAAHLEQGKSVLLEALDSASRDFCKGFLKKLKRNPAPLDAKSELLLKPFLFLAPPEGYSGNQVQVGDHVIYSEAGYGLAWAGKSAAGAYSRSDIRSVHEWGVNLISYCVAQAGN